MSSEIAVLKIQPSQIQACEAVARANFVDRVQIHLRAFLPDECKQIGDAGLVQLIDTGIDKAAEHAIEAEEGVVKFITLMLAFGKDFDIDPQHGWARRVLGRKDLHDPIRKADLLYDAAVEQTRIDEGIPEDVLNERNLI